MKTTLIKNKDSLKFSPYQMARLEDLLLKGRSFKDSDKFKEKNFCDKLNAYHGPEIDTQWLFNYVNSLDGINKSEFSKSVTLNSKQEELLFLKYNYIKKTIASLSRLNIGDAYERMLQLDDDASSVKDQLVGANLGLVLNISRKNTFPYVDFTEAVSEGQIFLLDAIEGFDPGKGNKFSTYFTLIFTRALIKVNNMNKKSSSNSVEYDPSIHDTPYVEESDSVEFLDLISKFLSGDTGLLDEDELFVLRKKYVEGLTLHEIGQFYDPIKTKGQVFYIEKKGRLKIGDALTALL